MTIDPPSTGKLGAPRKVRSISGCATQADGRRDSIGPNRRWTIVGQAAAHYGSAPSAVARGVVMGAAETVKRCVSGRPASTAASPKSTRRQPAGTHTRPRSGGNRAAAAFTNSSNGADDNRASGR